MRKDWAKLMDALKTLSIPAEEFVPKIVSGEWESKAFQSRKDDAYRLLSEFTGKSANILELLQKIERLEELCRQPWEAQWAKIVVDKHIHPSSDAWIAESDDDLRKIADSMIKDWFLAPIDAMYPDFGSDPEDQIPFPGLDDAPKATGICSFSHRISATGGTGGPPATDGLEPSPFE